MYDWHVNLSNGNMFSGMNIVSMVINIPLMCTVWYNLVRVHSVHAIKRTSLSSTLHYWDQIVLGDLSFRKDDHSRIMGVQF